MTILIKLSIPPESKNANLIGYRKLPDLIVALTKLHFRSVGTSVGSSCSSFMIAASEGIGQLVRRSFGPRDKDSAYQRVARIVARSVGMSVPHNTGCTNLCVTTILNDRDGSGVLSSNITRKVCIMTYSHLHE